MNNIKENKREKELEIVDKIHSIYSQLNEIYDLLNELDPLSKETFDFLMAKIDIGTVSFNLLTKNS